VNRSVRYQVIALNGLRLSELQWIRFSWGAPNRLWSQIRSQGSDLQQPKSRGTKIKRITGLARDYW